LLTALIGDIGHTKPLIGFCMLVSMQTLHRYLCYVPNHKLSYYPSNQKGLSVRL